MSDKTHIEWTDATWNPITGCSVVSKGCTNCYAMQLAGTRLKHHESRKGLTGMTKAGPVWNGQVRFNYQWLDQPMRWKKPRMIFVCAHGDLFHENVPHQWIDRVFAVMALCPQHTFQVLSKRPERMREYLQKWYVRDSIIDRAAMMSRNGDSEFSWLKQQPWPLTNVWLGVSVEDQATANERIPLLLDTPAAVRWISAEPLLGPIDLNDLEVEPFLTASAFGGHHDDCFYEFDNGIDWVVVGGESGPKARPMHPDWVRDLRDQCKAASVPFFFKQWGEWAPGECLENAPIRKTNHYAEFYNDQWHYGKLSAEACEDLHVDDEPDVWKVSKKAAGHLLDGQVIQQYPEVKSARS